MAYNMSSSYIPGGNDDFWMPVPAVVPEVVSPAPQRYARASEIWAVVLDSIEERRPVATG